MATATPTQPAVALVNQPWNPALPPVQLGSIAIWNYEVALRLADSHAVSIYARRSAGRPRIQHRDGVEYRRFPTFPEHNHWLSRLLGGGIGAMAEFASPAFYLAFGQRVARHLGRRSPAVVHLQNLSQFAPLIRRYCPDARILLHMHCEWLNQFPAHIVRERLACVDRVVGCSKYIKDRIAAAFPEVADRCDVIYNGVDTQRFCPSPTPGKADPARPVVSFVGRISPEKGLHNLFDAVALLREEFAGLTLNIIGPHAETPRGFLVDLSDEPTLRDLSRFYGERHYLACLKAQAASLNLDVHFHGAIAHDALTEHYRQADVIVNPSLSESFGMTLIEAMACARPVVATRVGGMPDIVEHGVSGLLAPPGDPIALAEQLRRLLSKPAEARAMGEAGRHAAQARFDWQQVADGTAAQYQRMLDGDPI